MIDIDDIEIDGGLTEQFEYALDRAEQNVDVMWATVAGDPFDTITESDRDKTDIMVRAKKKTGVGRDLRPTRGRTAQTWVGDRPRRTRKG